MVIDVFFCESAGEGRRPPLWLADIRQQMAKLCYMRWILEDANVKCLTPEIVKSAGYNAPFQKSRRQYAEDHATSEFYVVVDDDILIQSGPVVGPVVDILRREPTIGIIALHNSCSTRPPTGKYITAEVEQSHAVGGCRFMRKGILPEWPPMVPDNPYQYDVQHGMAIEAAGYMSCYTTRGTIGMLHLGYTYSMTWSGERHLQPPPRQQTVVDAR